MTTDFQQRQYKNIVGCLAEITVALNSIERIVGYSFKSDYDDVKESVSSTRDCLLTMTNTLFKIGERLETQTLEN